jgi:FkbM family methyltransferase
MTGFKKAIKSLYSVLPFKRPIYEALKKIYRPAPRIYQHLHFKDVFRVPVTDSEMFKILHYGFEIENELFWAGIKDGWEKVSTGLWIELCRESEVIIDIGANTGVYSLIAKTVNPTATVYAFEPVERVFEKLQRNCQLNNYEIVCFKKAVSNYNGKAKIYDTDGDHIYSVTVNKNLNSSATAVKEFEIETITLKDFIENQELTKIDLMKIDVETHEPEVLEGMHEYLAKFNPVMLIEILNEEVATKVNKLLAGLEYLYFNIDENNGIRQVKEVTKSDYYNFLFCKKETALKLGLNK